MTLVQLARNTRNPAPVAKMAGNSWKKKKSVKKS